MIFEKGKTYVCLHDLISETTLYFKKGHYYVCPEEGYLNNCNRVKTYMLGYNNIFNLTDYFRKVETSELENTTFESVCQNMINLYKKKNKDYGNSFDKSCDEFGITAALVRMQDKFNRIKSLAINNKQEVKDESIKDTLIDLANYSIMTLLWYVHKTDSSK